MKTLHLKLRISSLVSIIVLLSAIFLMADIAKAACGDKGEDKCPASFMQKFVCPSGSFLDPRLDDLSKGPECWSCPGGYNRTGWGITSNKACSKPGSTEYKKADKKNKPASIFHSCPGKQWASLHNGYCYKCPGGYSHDPSRNGDDSKVCYKTHGEELKSATYIKKASTCPEGTFFDPRNGGECWKCPKGYSRGTTTAVTSNDACYDSRVCGKEGKQACNLWERIPSCNEGLKEVLGTCEKLKPGEDPFWGGIVSSLEKIASGAKEGCKDLMSSVGEPDLKVEELNATATCSLNMSSGFFCSIPNIVSDIAGAGDIIQKINAASESKGCSGKSISMPHQKFTCGALKVLIDDTIGVAQCIIAASNAEVFQDMEWPPAFSGGTESLSPETCRTTGEISYDVAKFALLQKAAGDLKPNASKTEKIFHFMAKTYKIVGTAATLNNFTEKVKNIKECK